MWGSENPWLLSAGKDQPRTPKCPDPVGKIVCSILGDEALKWLVDKLQPSERPQPQVTDERAGIPKEGTVPAPGGGWYIR